MDRLSECEDVMDACARALALIPVWALRRGHQWMPSEYEIALIAEAKDALVKYTNRHLGNGNNA